MKASNHSSLGHLLSSAHLILMDHHLTLLDHHFILMAGRTDSVLGCFNRLRKPLGHQTCQLFRTLSLFLTLTVTFTCRISLGRHFVS